MVRQASVTGERNRSLPRLRSLYSVPQSQPFNNRNGNARMHTPNTTGKRNRVIAAVILAVIGIVGSLKLKSENVISEPSLVIFVSFSVLAGLFIAFVERIESISLRKMDLKLKEMQETEESVKELGKAIHDVFETKSHGMMLESYDAEAADAAMAQLKKLIS